MAAGTVEDLSTRHEPVGDLFAAEIALDPAALRLSDADVQFFRENGYVAGPQVLSPAQIEALRAELEGFFDPSHPGRDLWHEYHTNESTDPNTVLFHALGAWRIGPGLHDILYNPRITVPASQLLEGSARFWHDQLFCKPPHQGGVVAWHQDYSYWTRTKPLAHLTCWIGLDKSTRENGCVQYVPGSHTWDLLPITGLAGDMEAIHEVLTPEQRARFDNPVAVELEAGQCVFHHALTVHGSQPNVSNRPRRAIVLNFIRDGVHSDTDEPLMQNVPPIPKGQPLGGRFHPLLYQV